MKRQLHINGDLRAEILKGAKIISYYEGEYYTMALIENIKGSEYKFAQYENSPSLASDKMHLAINMNYTKGQAKKAFSKDFYDCEHHAKRHAKPNNNK